MPPEEKAMPLCNVPAIDADRHICLHVHDRLVTLEERNSRPVVLWEYVTGGRVPGPVVFGQDGNLRFHCSDGCLHCINLAASRFGRRSRSVNRWDTPLRWSTTGETRSSAHFDGGLDSVDPDGRVRKSG